MQETPESEWADAIKPGVLGADEFLINSLGAAEAAKYLGISNPYRNGKLTAAASTAFEEYSRAWAKRVSEALRSEKASTRHHATKKSPAQLDREIAQALATKLGRPELAALRDPRGFARELRRQLQAQQLKQKGARFRAAYPYVVKHLDRGLRAILGNFATDAEARERADAVDGWVEHGGRVIHGVEKQSRPSTAHSSHAQKKTALKDIEPGLRNVARRSVDAENRFIDYAMEHGRLSRGQAETALAAFRKARVIKFDVVNGTFHVKHGQFLEPDVLRRAAGVEE